MGIFDIDSGTDNHLLNEQFHVFSKSPASVATALGDASNRSGHTVTASDVWGQEIPAFFYAKTQAVAQTYKSLAKTNDLCRIGNSVAIFENGDWVIKYNSYTDIPDGHKFKNAAGDDVIRFHKNRLAYNLNLDNNAADDGLNTTAKIQGWDEENGKVYDYVATAPKFVTQFVTSTDKIVDGIPSKGFGPFVMAGTTTGDITKVLPEGTSDQNHYIANSFAGIIQFNMARTDAIYVHAFEYCGKTLKSAYSDIVELEDKLNKISVTASGGIQGVSEDATTAGLSTKWVKLVEGEEVDAQPNEEGAYPVLTIETGTIDEEAADDKLVTGSTVKTYVDTTALAEGGSIAEYIENYVATNAKVSVNGQSATTITVAGTEESSSDIVHVIVTEDKTTTDKIGLKLTATIDAAVLNEDGSIKEDGVVIATIAEKIADSAIKDAIETDNGAIKDAIKDAIEDATLNSGTQGDNQIQNATGDTANKLVTAAQVKEYVTENAQVTVTVGETDVTSTGFEFAGDAGTDVSVGAVMNSNGKVTYSATLSKATVDATTGAITNDSGSLAVSATNAEKIAIAKAKAEIEAAVADGAVIDSRIDEVLTANTATLNTDNTIKTGDESKFVTASDAEKLANKAANAVDTGLMTIDSTASNGISLASGSATDSVKVSVTPAVYTKSSDASALGTWDSQKLDNFATAQTISDAIADVKAYADGLHSTSLDYVVLGDNETLPTASAETLGKIYLVKEGNTANGETNIDALSGSYVEYMTRKIGEGTSATYAWEKIGTTDADLSAYAKKADLKVIETTANGLTYSQTNGLVSASVAKASTTQVGTVQLTNTYTSTDDTNAATGKSIAAAIDTLDAEKSVNGITVTQENGVITSVTEELIIATVPTGTTSVEGNVAFVGVMDVVKHVIAPEKFETAAQMPDTLTSWVADLSNLTTGDNMFKGCISLVTFVGDLSSLTSAVDMFNGCTLDAESLEILSENLPTVSGGTIDIGASVHATAEVIATIKGKGWTLKSNGNPL